MNRASTTLCVATLSYLVCVGGSCNRAHVESMNEMNEGVILAQQRQYADSTERLEHATVLDPQNDQAFWNLAIVHMQMQKYDVAKEDLTHAIAVNPSSGGYQEKLGEVCVQLSDWTCAQ